MKRHRTTGEFEHVGKSVFRRQVQHRRHEQGDPDAKYERGDDAPDTKVETQGRACRRNGWWHRDDMEVR